MRPSRCLYLKLNWHFKLFWKRAWTTISLCGRMFNGPRQSAPQMTLLFSSPSFLPRQRSTVSSPRSRCRSVRRATCPPATTWSTSRCSPLRTNQRCSAVRTSSPATDLLLPLLPPFLPLFYLSLSPRLPPSPLTAPQTPPSENRLPRCTAWCGRDEPQLPGCDLNSAPTCTCLPHPDPASPPTQVK